MYTLMLIGDETVTRLCFRRDIILAGASPLFTDHAKVGNYNALWVLEILLYTPFSENMLCMSCDAFYTCYQYS